MTPGAYPHAQVAIGSDPAPVIETGLGVQLPPEGTIDLLKSVERNGFRRAAMGALFADRTKILNSYIHRPIRYKRKVRRHTS